MTIHANDHFRIMILKDYSANKLRWTKTTLLTLQEALFLSYGIEPPTQLNPTLLLNFNRFLMEIDVYHIHELSQRAIDSGDLQPFDRQHIKSVDFVKWAQKFEIPIQAEFFFKENEDVKNEPANAPERRRRAESIRIQIFRDAAELFWRREEIEVQNPHSKLKNYTSPSHLAKSKDMSELAKLLNKIGGLDPVQGGAYSDSGVDPEWFSSLYPGETKPGPKRKKR